ncbi:hypothetical protein GCM10028817_41470 [Spirosoma pomorum]
MFVRSSKAHLDELTKSLIELKRERENEIIEIRLKGVDAQHGTLPLHMIGSLSLAFEETLVEIGKYAKYGTKKRKQAHSETRKELDVKLRSLATGSTRMFVSVESNPDIFGSSLSEVCLSRTFDVLRIDSTEELVETSMKVGSPALRTLNRFLKSLLDFNLEVDLNWQTPIDTELIWEGKRTTIQRIHSALESITQVDPFEIIIEGELVTQSLKGQGKFEIITDQNLTIAGTVPLYALPQFIQIGLGKYCRATVMQTVVQNQSTGNNKNFYELRSIEVIDKEKPPTQQSLF